MSEAEYSPVEEYESAVDVEPADSGPSERKNRFDKLMVVCWGTSFALVGLLLALATLIVIWVKAPEEEPIAFELATEMPVEEEEVQKKIEQKKLEKSSSSASSRSAIVVTSNISDIESAEVDFTIGLDKGVGDVGISGNVGTGNLGLDMGAMGMASFFGMQAKGNRFAFIIDYSASMSQTQLTVMKRELIKTLNAFTGGVQVSLIFFSGPAFIAGTDPNQAKKHWDNPGRQASNFVPKKGWRPPVPKWLACTSGTKDRLGKHIKGTRITFGTDWRNPFRMAYSMRPYPHVIYFMTDGAVGNPPLTVEMVKRNRAIQVNSIAFGISGPKAEKPMKEMAKLTGGTFKSYSKQQIAKMAAK